jgi:hypothetical protein
MNDMGKIESQKSGSKGRINPKQNCSSELTVQANAINISKLPSSYKPSESNFTSNGLGKLNHYRKKSEVTYNFFLNKQSSSIDSKAKNSNNSLNNHANNNIESIELVPSRKLTKLEKYFKNNGANVPLIKSNFSKKQKPHSPNKTVQFHKSPADSFAKGVTFSPKTMKDNLASHLLNSVYSHSKVNFDKKRSYELSRSYVSLDKIDLNPIFSVEQAIFDVMETVHKEEELLKTFMSYIELDRDKNFEMILNSISMPAVSENFKNAFIFERMGLIICFYLSRKGLYQKELIFVKKIVILAYSNLFVFLKLILNELSTPQFEVI